MKKDRFVAFFDAIMAIIMTIAVLEFAQPSGVKWSDLKHLGFQVLVYALSFFWLGMMWISIHNLWNHVEYISRGVMVINLIMLFFSSMIPFLVIYVGQNFRESVPQILYGLDVVCITICNYISSELLARHNTYRKSELKSLRLLTVIDICIKSIGFIIGITVYPPAIMISVFIAIILLFINYLLLKKKTQ